MDLVVPLRSDQNPNRGPVRSPLRLKADRPRPRKYGGASRICRYFHMVGRMTAGGQSKGVGEQRRADPPLPPSMGSLVERRRTYRTRRRSGRR